MRKFLMISSRSSFFLSACITSTLIPSNLSSLYNYLARSLLCTKISIGGLYPSAKTCLSVASFPSSDPVYINFYLTVVAVAFLIPTWTLMGSSVIICFITYSIPGCIVAENKNLQILWLFLQWLKTATIYSKNPNSNILSASSITRNSRFSRGNCSASLWSFNGVEINISQQFTKSLY